MKSVVTLGTFDGVHKGHQAILKKLVRTAQKENLKSIVLVFEKPVKQVSGILTTINEKIKYFLPFDIDDVFVLPVNKKITSITAEKFLEDFLIKELNASHLVVGYDCTFGKDRKGNIEWLKKNIKKYGIKLTVVKPVKINNKIVSSSLIREELEKNNIKEVNKMLGGSFGIEGTHITGDRIGRTLGFPTVNIKTDKNKLLPRGVFSCSVIDKNYTLYKGVLNIGTRPSVKLKKHNLSVEVHLINFSGTWRSKQLTVLINKFIRPEQKFNNLEELKKAIASDIKKA